MLKYILGLVVLSNTLLYAQNNTGLGIMGAFALNSHSADFRTFPGVPSCCPRYDDGSGPGMLFGIFYRMPIARGFGLSLRASYSSLNGTLDRTEQELLSGGVQGSFLHQVQARIADIGIEPVLQYNVLDRLWLNAGFRVGYVAGKTFSQKEQLQTPGFLFSNGRTIRNEVNDQPIPQASGILAGIVSGIGYNLPLDAQSNLVLSPELSYLLPLSNIVQGIDWKISQLRFGASLTWYPVPKPDPVYREERQMIIDTVEQPGDKTIAEFILGKELKSENTVSTDLEVLTTITIRRTDTLRTAKPAPVKPPFMATVTANAYYENNTETPIAKIDIEEFAPVLMTPLLPYIFFEQNDAVIPARYKILDASARQLFREESVNNSDKLFSYYYLLNIIGKRMQQNPDAILTITGCNADIAEEKGNIQLSQKRAEAVKQYLVDTWQIPEGRLKVEARNLPSKPGNSQNKAGAEENRRVEFTSNTLAITAPLITNDTLYTITPPSIRFRSKIIHENDIAEWKLQIRQENTILKTFNGTGNIPAVLSWDLQKEKAAQPRGNSSISYSLIATDVKGEKVETLNTLPVEQITIRKKRSERIADKEIQRFSLIPFDARVNEITPANKNIIALIKPYITPSSTIRIVGYADRLGDARQNQLLAEARAKNTASELGMNSNTAQISAEGNSDTYAPELPEGRMYTRIVDIVIETPVK
jgi:outer membrane protein OmpA-like peptidoglycan-associated protein